MSFILDALRKVEHEKKEQPATVDIKTQLLVGGSRIVSTRVIMVLAGAAALALSSAVAWATILYLKDPNIQETSLSPVNVAVRKAVKTASVNLNTILPTAIAEEPVEMTVLEDEDPLLTAPHTDSVATDFDNDGLENNAYEELDSGLAGWNVGGTEAGIWEEEVFDEPLEDERAELRKAELTGADHRAGPTGEEAGSPASEERPKIEEPVKVEIAEKAIKERDTAPPVKAAPAEIETAVVSRPDFVLEGIVFHSNPKSRSAMIRKKGDRAGKLVRIGDMLYSFEVAQIELSSVILSGGGEEVTLSMEE